MQAGGLEDVGNHLRLRLCVHARREGQERTEVAAQGHEAGTAGERPGPPFPTRVKTAQKGILSAATTLIGRHPPRILGRAVAVGL